MENSVSSSITDHIKQYWWLNQGKALPYGLGCAYFSHPGPEGHAADLRSLNYSYESGCRYYDSAPAYRDSELRVGEFIETIDRKSIFLATKIERKPPEQDVSTWMRESLARSQDRLRVDTFELIQLHDQDFIGLLEGGHEDEIVAIVQEWKDAGIIKYFGLGMRQFDQLSRGLDCDYIQSILPYSDYTPIEPIAGPIIEKAHRMDKAVINGTPLGGFLTGKDPMEREKVHPTVIEKQAKAKLAYDYCQGTGISTLEAAIRFPMLDPRVTITLTGSSTLSHLISNIDAMHKEIPDEFWRGWEKAVGVDFSPFPYFAAKGWGEGRSA